MGCGLIQQQGFGKLLFVYKVGDGLDRPVSYEINFGFSTPGRSETDPYEQTELSIIGKNRGIRGKKGAFFKSISITFIFIYPYYTVYYHQI